MHIKILIILACVPLYVINSFCDKIISAKKGDRCNTLYNCIKFFLCSLCMLPLLFAAPPARVGMGSVICGLICGLLYTVSKTVMLKGYETSSVAFMTLCHSSGMILPCIVGHFLWNEKLNFFGLFGIVITVLSILLLKGSGGKKDKIQTVGILCGLVIFLTSGGVMLTQKTMGHSFQGEGVTLYTLYSFLLPTLLLGILSGSKVKSIDWKKDGKLLWLCASGSALSLAAISLVMTFLAADVPSVILFPLFNGTGIIALCIFSVFAFGEKLNLKKAIGLILGVLGLCLINL